MFGYIQAEGRGDADRLLAGLAKKLLAQNVVVTGVVQFNTERQDGQPCDMDLSVLAQNKVIRISQTLGPMAQGCRLDAAALEQAVEFVERGVQTGGIQLLIINKFGRQEAEGRGFRPVIGQAIAQGIPVLTSVAFGKRDAFDAFSDGMAEKITCTDDALSKWCERVIVQ